MLSEHTFSFREDTENIGQSPWSYSRASSYWSNQEERGSLKPSIGLIPQVLLEVNFSHSYCWEQLLTLKIFSRRPPPWSAPGTAPPLLLLPTSSIWYSKHIIQQLHEEVLFLPPLQTRFMTAHMFSEIANLSKLVPIFSSHCLWTIVMDNFHVHCHGYPDGKALGSDVVGISAPHLPGCVSFIDQLVFHGSHHGCFRGWEHGGGPQLSSCRAAYILTGRNRQWTSEGTHRERK